MDPCSVGTPKPHREPHNWASRGKPWSRDSAHRPRSTDIPGIGHFNLVSWSPKLELMSFFAPNWWVQNHKKLKHPVLVHLWRCCDRKNLNAFSHNFCTLTLPPSTMVDLKKWLQVRNSSGFKSIVFISPVKRLPSQSPVGAPRKVPPVSRFRRASSSYRKYIYINPSIRVCHIWSYMILGHGIPGTCYNIW